MNKKEKTKHLIIDYIHTVLDGCQLTLPKTPINA